jgi:hypothetical protein
MKYSIYTACARHIRTIDFGGGLKLDWVRNENGGKLFHFSSSEKHWAMTQFYSWMMIFHLFNYHITLTLK